MTFRIPFLLIVTDLMTGLARNGFRNLVILNGHGGGQTAILKRVAEEVGRRERDRGNVETGGCQSSADARQERLVRYETSGKACSTFPVHIFRSTIMTVTSSSGGRSPAKPLRSGSSFPPPKST
jgi:creatinine amidohydrolase/Fe(II)-dependent formamide hydrolase-like protein